MSTRHTSDGRIDPDHYETSPSCGTFETAGIMGCPDAHAVEETADIEDATMFRDTAPTFEVVL